MIYQIEFAYLQYFKNLLSGASQTSSPSNQRIKDEDIDRILCVTLGMDSLKYSDLTHEWSPPALNDAQVVALIDKFKSTLDFNKIKDADDYVDSFKEVLDQLQNHRKQIQSSYLLIRSVCLDEFNEQLSNCWYVIDQVTNDVWLVTEEYVNQIKCTNLSPLYSHILSKDLRSRELRYLGKGKESGLPESVISVIGDAMPSGEIEHIETELDDDFDEYTVETKYSPLLLVRGMQFIPLRDAEYSAIDMFYIGGFPTLAVFCHFDPDCMLGEFALGAEFEDFQDENYYSPLTIILMTGYLLNLLARNGSLSVTDANRALDARALRDSHNPIEVVELLRFMCELNGHLGDMDLIDECGLIPELKSPKLLDITEGIADYYPVKLDKSKESVHGVLFNAKNITLHNNDFVDFIVGDCAKLGDENYPVCKADAYILSGDFDGVRRYYLGVSGILPNFSFGLSNKIQQYFQDVDEDLLLAFCFDISNLGINNHGEFEIQDPFHFVVEEDWNGFVLSRGNQLIAPAYDSLVEIPDFESDDISRMVRDFSHEWLDNIFQLSIGISPADFSTMALRLELQNKFEKFKTELKGRINTEQLRSDICSGIDPDAIREKIAELGYEYYKMDENCITVEELPSVISSQYFLAIDPLRLLEGVIYH